MTQQTNNNASGICPMGDKEVLTDLLSGQKFISANYNAYAGECVNTNLRNEFLNILKEEHTIQNEIFNEMSTRGWYPTKPAPASEITCALQKFSMQ